MDRPIIFSGPMVQALLAGRKTQTRRLATSPLRKCEVGDRLYVRENHRFRGADYGDSAGEIEWFRCYSEGGAGDNWDPTFPVGWEPTRHANVRELTDASEQEGDGIRGFATKLLPSIHMPRWASRLTLIVECVKVDPLQAISEAYSRAEGLQLVRKTFPPMLGCEDALREREVYEWPGGWSVSAVKAYEALWSSLHTKDGQRWDDNPDVVALTFSVVRENIDAISSPAGR